MIVAIHSYYFSYHNRQAILADMKNILLIAANPSLSTTLGWPVGFWASELIHPYDEFTKAGHHVTIASPAGGKLELDAYSDPRDASGYSKDDTLSLQYLGRQEFTALLENSPAIGALNPADYDAVLVAGGQSPMFTFRGNTHLLDIFRSFLDSGKPSAALCHGTCLLLDLKLADGTPLIKGRRITGFANSEEDFADQAVGQKVMPFRIEDEARALGADFIAGPAFQPHAVQDGNLITGQQQHSGRVTAELVLEALAR
ncbi:MAG: type 1 glutamine amidotransferase domain-containing protein [Terrimicrobiaceae bacterium]